MIDNITKNMVPDILPDDFIHSRHFYNTLVGNGSKEYSNTQGIIPVRSTALSAGYDLKTPIDITIPSDGSDIYVPLGIAVDMEETDCFKIFNRSSSPKKGYIMTLGTGIIDADYFGNPSNHGEIMVVLRSIDGKEHFITAGTAVAQGIFERYLLTDDDNASGARVGGIGSTDKS
jgi:dUTP pyrophosphatase